MPELLQNHQHDRKYEVERDDYFRIKKAWPLIAIMILGSIFSVCMYNQVDISYLKPWAVFNVAAGICMLITVTILTIVVSLERTQVDQGTFLFYCMLFLNYLGIFFDDISWLFDGNVDYIGVNFLMSFGSYLVFPLMAPVFWRYQNAVFMTDEEKKPIREKLLIGLLFVDIAYILWATKTQTLFYIDKSGLYQTGRGFSYIYVYPFLTLFLCIYDNIKRNISLGKRIALLIFSMSPLIISVISLMSSRTDNYSYLHIVLFFDLLLMYGAIQMERSIERMRQSKELAEKNVELAERGKELMEQQTQLMVSQIQPHFLYNTLSVIAYLCEEDSKKAVDAINNFALYLRMNMDSLGSIEPVPFEKELNHTKTYLQIEKMRFGDILNVEYEIGYSDFVLPPLTLQPIVENAVKYGIRGKEEGGIVTIITYKEEDKIYIIVEDDGIGFDVNQKKNDGRSHVGMENVRNRLKLLGYGEIRTESEIGRGTTVTMILEDKK